MIRLIVISAPATGVAAGFTMVFGPGGGTIGRSHHCTWQLADPDCLISRTHAEIDISHGHYRITDHSTNGLFINHADTALGCGNSVSLHHGDRIRLGHYLLAIEIEAERGVDATDDLGPADFLGVDIPLLTPLPASPRTTTPLAGAAILPVFDSIKPQWSPTMSFNETTAYTAPAATHDPLPDLEQQLRLALQPFAGNMVMDFNQRELLALVTYLVGRAKHANATTT